LLTGQRAGIRRLLQRMALTAFKSLGFSPWLQRFALRRTHQLFLVGVLGLVVDEHDRLLLFHHTYRRRHAWGLPGGWIARGERPAEALQREVREESSLHVRPQGLHCVLLEDAGPWVEIVLRAELCGGSFTPSPEVDRMQLVGPGEQLPPDLQASHRRLVEELLAGGRSAQSGKE